MGLKKNKMMRVASGLLVTTLLTTSVIGGTFAKYVSTDSVADTARVAKWGVELQVDGSLYSTKYDTQNAAAVTDDTATVKSTSTPAENIVAPGTASTEGMGLHISVTGTPEVAGKITAVVSNEGDEALKDIYLKAGTYGHMVKLGKVSKETYDAKMAEASTDKLYTLESNNYAVATSYISGTEYYTIQDKVTVASDYHPVKYSIGTQTDVTLEKAAKEIVDKLNGKDGQEFAPGDDLAEKFGFADNTLTWKWEFEAANGANNGADTILGLLQSNAASVVKIETDGKLSGLTADSDYSLKTAFNLTITVEQTD